MPAETMLRYLKNGLASTPTIMNALAAGITPAELDARPDPERFTLREAMAHWADWEPIWRERMTRIRTEDNPTLPDIDEEQRAIDNDYAHSDFDAEIARFASGRAAMVSLLSSVTGDEWERTGFRENVGLLTLFELAVLILGHDAYHLRQFAEFRAPEA